MKRFGKKREALPGSPEALERYLPRENPFYKHFLKSLKS